MKEKLNIDYLKNNHKRLYYFGLGFIQLTLNDYERIHFYSLDLKTKQTNDEIHNHRYNFDSYILKGNLIENIYELSDGLDYIIMNESCGKDLIMPDIKIECGINHLNTFNHIEGNKYKRFYNEFHSVDYNEDTITYLKRSDIIMNYAQVIYPKNREKTCPFSTKISDNDLWDIINKMI